MSKQPLYDAIHRTIGLSIATAVGLSACAVAVPALAQGASAPGTKKKPQTLQTVVVTGSHIRGVDLVTSNPVVTVSAEQIKATGDLTLGQVVQNLPVITGGAENPAVDNGGGSGATEVGLRGLGASRTLFLIDGQRVINDDLNAIPANAVESIQVLTDGASAIYGSDAIGGVINVILKSHYDGAQFQANYGISDHGDGQRHGYNFLFGHTTDKGSILAGVSYNKMADVFDAARAFSKNAYGLTTTANGGVTKVISGSSYAARGNITVPQAIADKFGCTSGNVLSLNTDVYNAGTSPTTAADYHCYGPSDAYNFGPHSVLVVPQERTNAFFRGTYRVSKHTSFYATVLHNTTDAQRILPPAVWGSGRIPTDTLVSADNFYNPFGVPFSVTSGNGDTMALVAAGERVNYNKTVTSEGMAGFKGSVMLGSFDWHWNVGMDYGHIHTGDVAQGLPSSDVLLPGLGPSFKNAQGVIQCGTPASPIARSTCTPWDPFNLNSSSAIAAIQGSLETALINSWDIEKVYHASADGGIFRLPAGTVQLAVGALHRTEYTNNAVDPVLLLNPATGTCTLSSECSAHLQGGFNVKTYYGEMNIPILKDLPFVHGLSIDLGDRYSKYSDFGSSNNWKVGIAYRPIQSLLLRGTVATVFRAPSIGDVFAAPASSAPFIVSDPCDGITSPNPACVGVPTNGTFVDQFVKDKTQIPALSTGSKFSGFSLGPETGKSFDFGAVWSPTFVPGLTLNADVWRIYLNHVITPDLGAQTILSLCFVGESVYCPLIKRFTQGASAGQIENITQPTLNLGSLNVKGVDFGGHYRLPDFSFGQFEVGLNATYMSQFKIETAPGVSVIPPLEGAGTMGDFGSALASACPFAGDGDCFFPRTRAQGFLNWQLGPWSAQWRMRFISKFREAALAGKPGTPGFNPNEVGVNRYGATVYNDLTASYDIQPLNTDLSVGVNNVFNKQPPLLFYPEGLNDNTDPQDFDVLGRYYWVRLTVNF